MRWAGKIGYSRNVETAPGVHEDQIVEVRSRGDLLQTTHVLRSDDNVLGTVATTTSISVVTNGLRVPLSSIKYVTFDGANWQITSVVRQPPRLVMYLGEEYRGPTPQ